jgi:hypothetical protein
MTTKYRHGKGCVKKIFPDDLKGSQHQKFTLTLKDKSTVLVVHNIDICKRISGLRVGDSVEFFGVFQWNRFGGLIHWTHKNQHSSDIEHKDGWLKHNGILYQ